MEGQGVGRSSESRMEWQEVRVARLSPEHAGPQEAVGENSELCRVGAEEAQDLKWEGQLEAH